MIVKKRACLVDETNMEHCVGGTNMEHHDKGAGDGGATARRAKRPRTIERSAAPPAIARIYPAEYAERLQAKVELLNSRLAAAVGASADSLPPLEVFESEREHFRMRATFKLWHEGDDVHYAMFDKAHADARTPLEVSEYPMGSRRLCALMPLVLDGLRRHLSLIHI